MKEKYIDLCIKEALRAQIKNEIPVGAVIVKDDVVIAKSCNNREEKLDITGHAEVNAIKKAAKNLKTWKLNDCDLYVTLKPCTMCEKIIKQSRIRNVYYLLDKFDYKKEYDKTVFNKLDFPSKEGSYSQILNDFFKDKR